MKILIENVDKRVTLLAKQVDNIVEIMQDMIVQLRQIKRDGYVNLKYDMHFKSIRKKLQPLIDEE